MDKAAGVAQDSLNGFVADLTQAQIDVFLCGAARGTATAGLLGSATSRIVYDFRAICEAAEHDADSGSCLCRNDRARDARAEPGRWTSVPAAGERELLRWIRARDSAEGASRCWAANTDGGAVVTTRWIGSGWTVFNNKGKPVRKYEPFFADTADFSFGTAVGVSATLFYDPVGRVVATLHPDHSWEKVLFDPWRQDTWDANDTVLIADPSSDADAGAFFQRLPQNDYLPTWYAQQNNGGSGSKAQDAAQKTAVHANTPTTVHFDTLARPFLTLAFNRSQLNAEPVVEGHYRRPS